MVFPNGYETFTTFHMDFSIADKFGINAIKDTYNRAFKGWKDNYKYFTELVMILNVKSWEWHKKDHNICDLYIDLYYKAREYALTNYKDDELRYFWRTTD